VIASDVYHLLRHAELVREAELDAEIRRHPDRIVRRRTRPVRRLLDRRHAR